MADLTRRTKLPPTITGRLFGQPIAMEADALDELLAADPQALAGFGPRTSRGYFAAEGVAVVPVVGTLMARGTGIAELDALLGICALDELRSTLMAAASDASVRHILLDVDSPGGPIAGMFDAAGFVATVNKQKTITTYARRAMSAAYLLASATSRIVVPPNEAVPAVGSIGVRAVRRDVTAQDAAEGVAYHVITSGDAKADGFEHAPVTDGELARLRAAVGEAAGMFFTAVASARGVTAEHVRGLEAQKYRGQAAVDVGLANQVATFEDTILELATRPREEAAPTTRRMSMSTESKGAVVASITDHPDFKATIDAERAAAATRASRIGDLCMLAGQPEKAAEFIASAKTVDEVSAWAVAERAKATTATTGINGNQQAAAAETPIVLDTHAIFAKRREADLAALNAHLGRLH